MSDLLRLSKPFPSQFIESKPGAYSADYVKHSTVNEFLLGIVGTVRLATRPGSTRTRWNGQRCRVPHDPRNRRA